RGLRPREPERLAVVESHPHDGQKVWGVANKPGIPIVIGRTGFARSRTLEPPLPGTTTGPALHDSLQQMGQQVGIFRRDHLFDLHRASLERFSLLISDPLYRER